MYPKLVARIGLASFLITVALFPITHIEGEILVGDLNGDGTINVLDVISLVNIILNPVPEDCLIIPEVGPCDGICPTYYYNQDSGQCEEFITGCCGIEAFDTQESCEEMCE